MAHETLFVDFEDGGKLSTVGLGCGLRSVCYSEPSWARWLRSFVRSVVWKEVFVWNMPPGDLSLDHKTIVSKP